MVAILIASNAVPAKPNITSFRLEFTPKQIIASAEVTLHRSMHEHPVQLRLVDERPVHEPSVVGSRTDDGDRRFELKTTNEVLPFVEQVLVQQLQYWGISVENDADLVLTTRLRRFTVTESNQAVGATFRAEARFAAELQNRSGDLLWNGSSFGDATRYGKKFSNPNCNEVLSDALLEAWSSLLSHGGLHDAWDGKVEPRIVGRESDSSSGTGGRDTASISATELLKEVSVLMEQGFELQTIMDYVSQKTLSAELHSDDLLNWKRAGVAEEVLRAVMMLPVR